MAAYHALVIRAFSDVPGAQVSSIDEMRGSLAPPLPRVLREQGEIIGFVSVAPGELHSLGLSPAARGRGLGDHLVTEGLRLLGQGEVALSVAARNDRALRLYHRHGFVPSQQTVMLRRNLAPPGSDR